MGFFDTIGSLAGGLTGGLGSLVGGQIGGVGKGFSQGVLPQIGAAGNNFQAMSPEQQQALQQQASQAQGAQNATIGQMNWLSDLYKQQALGQGPNPAMAQYQQMVNQNAANAAGAIASQKGINPALAARMASEAQVQANQLGAGQAGILGAQQQLAAEQAMGGINANITNAQLGQQQLAQNALATGQQQNLAAALANQQATNQAAQGNAANQTKVIGGLLGGAGAVGASALTPAAAVGAAHGARVPGKAEMPGDHKANDKVHAVLSPGEIVIPRTKAQDPDKAKAFVEALLKQEKARGGRVEYKDVLRSRKKAA